MTAPLSPGQRLGSYEVVELLGEGGMGTVYRAHDPRLGRDVAIKVVRAVFSGDPERAARFDREARLLAALNHPHVAVVHGLEEWNGIRVLVLELVDGPTLAERLREGPLSVREALTLALQIAAAIEAAHDRNIIHRDLKPANIKITRAGAVKVLDFGLAKALAIDATSAVVAQNPTQSAGGTGEGIILGTAAYMSPEQARGKEVDKRTDIWSFGCVLFDMLTGRRAFSGDTLSDTLAAILTREPDWTILPPDLPAPVRRLLHRCLEKDMHRRLRDIGDARFEIEEALSSSSDPNLQSAAPGVGAHIAALSAFRRPFAPLVAGTLVIGALLGAGVPWLLSPNRTPPRSAPVQFAMPVPAGDRLAGLDFHMLAISPADTHVAYVASRRGRPQLFLRSLSALEAQPLPGTEGALNPFFSPDGEWIAFFAGGKLKKIAVRGGSIRDIADAEIGFGGTWAPDGTIIFAASNASPLSRVSAEGGTPQPITTLDTARREFSHRWPEVLPDGDTVLFTIGTVGSWDDADVAVQQVSTGRRRILVQGGTFPRYSPTGHVLYARRGAVHALPVTRGYESAGTSAVAMEGVLQSVDGAAQFAISRTGGAVYVAALGGDERTLVWVDREGNVQPLAATPGAYSAPRLSPDGRSLALAVAGDREQVFTYSIPDNRLTQLTFDGGTSPVWSADGQRIFFSAARGGPSDVFVRAADGSGADQRLTRTDRAEAPQSALPGDAGVLFVEVDPTTGRDIFLLGAGGSTRTLIATPANEGAPAISPDGRTVAYVSDETGRPEVFLAPLNQPMHRVQVSSEGATEPVWRRDGGELFFRSGNRMMAARVSTRPALSAGPARLLFEGAFQTGGAGSPAYGVSSDGMRFLMLRLAAPSRERHEVRVFLGWTNALLRGPANQ